MDPVIDLLVLLVIVNFAVVEEHCMQKAKLATMVHVDLDYLQSLLTKLINVLPYLANSVNNV